MSLFEKCEAYNDPEIVKAHGIYPYFRPISGYAGPHVVVDGKTKIMIGSNNYLGLSHHPEVLEYAREAVDRYGSGCTGSRLLNGNMDLHDRLEIELADFLGKEAVAVFSTGFHANQGSIPTLTSRRSVIFSDRENHASITEGCSLSLGKVVRYAHNDMEALESLLVKYEDVPEKLIVTDGVFSMNGHLAELPAITALAKKYDAVVYVDDAHAVGVIGKTGRGTAEHFNVEADVALQMGTFSKAFASIGGFIAGPKKVATYIKHHSRSLIFSASTPPASVAVVLKCLEIIRREPELRTRLMENTERARQGLRRLGYNVGDSKTPIVPIVLNGDREFSFTIAQALFDKGLFATPVIPPAVPQGTSMIRTSYMATHSEEDIQRVIEVFKEVGEEFDLLGQQPPTRVETADHHGEAAAEASNAGNY